ncbi:MAG TPA: hypothetical protein VIV11_38140 [Kofleriaceae bacterium]
MRGVAIVLLAGCAVRTTTATPSQLAAHAPAFTQDGHAELVRSTGNVRVSAEEQVTVRLQEGDGLQRTATMTVRELVDGCNLDGPDQGCLARRAVEEPVLRHRERRVDDDRVVKLVGFSAIGGLVGYCAAECQGDGDLERGFAYTAGFIGGTLLLGFVAIMIGGRD